MNGLPDVIVGLWFIPVTLFILIPLAMLFCWGIGRLVKRLMVIFRAEEKKSAQGADAHYLANAGA
ncbi:MAG: hypothetical protein EHM86_03230 [Desulfobulbaceae bacterium]|nr:MAG: hypothetical protein EHM86_03230 [Desulfobulbaceae bacterium]